MSDFVCKKCGAQGGATHPVSGVPTEPMTPPVVNKYWSALQDSVCSVCWDEWKEMEIKIINEYRLNLLERDHRKLLKKHMNDFLGMGDGSTSADAVAANWQPEQK